MASRSISRKARAETQKEAQESFLPQAGVLLTRESSLGFVLAVPVCALLGVILVLPAGLIEFGGLSLATRLISAAAVGLFAGAVVGFVVGPSLGARAKARESAGASPGKFEDDDRTAGWAGRRR